MSETLTIARLGQRGDGIAETPSGPVAVPGALPGETVSVTRHESEARLLAVETPSPERAEPPCPLFGRCGGCAVQHMGPGLYAAWKRDLVVAALRKAGLDAPVRDLVDAHGEGRRRVVLHARRLAEGMEVGFMASRSHDLVPLAACPILAPGLAPAPRVAKALAEALAGSGKPLDIHLTALASGLDADIRGHGPVGGRKRQGLAALAERLDLARLSVHGDVIVQRRPCAIDVDGTGVQLPPGGFLQATRAGEEILGGLVLERADGAKAAADLFCGIGPFTLRLARHTAVHGVDGEAAAVAALQRATRETPGLKPVTTEQRDLFRRPLLPPELARFDAVVFDPPRAGAEAQARQIGASGVPLVIGIACSVATFARDAAVLVAAGYTLEEVVPVDQFRYAAHVEMVGTFRRAPARKRPARLFG